MLPDFSQPSPGPPPSPGINTIHFLPSSHGTSTSVGGNPQTPIPTYQLDPLVAGRGFGLPQIYVNPMSVGDRLLVGGPGEYVTPSSIVTPS